MVTPLLHTKFQTATVGNTIMVRPHLLQRLDGGLSAKVTLISAPAGFGKSTIVSSWLNQISAASQSAQSRNGSRHTSWLSLDEEDSHLPTFMLYLIAAIEACYPDCCGGMSQFVQERPSPTVEALANVLINGLSRQEGSLVLALDDLHLINDSAVFAFLARLIEYAPPQIHLVLISRVDPPLPLNRWRAAGYLNELRLHDLSFSLEETTTFLSSNLERLPPAPLIETLHKRTEGWVVGNWLALLALRGQNDYAEFALHFQANTNRYTVNYLVDEVLNRQPPAIQKFLVSTAILNRFCAGLCAAILEVEEQSALAQIQHLSRADLFLIELSRPAHWYRYHHQFQDMLLSRLHMRYDREAITVLHRQAAAWLIAHDFISEAIHHLTMIADAGAVADLIEQQRAGALNQLRFLDLEAWLQQVPSPLMDQRPALLVSMAWIQHDQVDNERCLAFVRRAQALLNVPSATLSPDTQQILEAELVALRTSLDDSMDRTTTLAQIRHSWAQIRPHLAFTHCHVVLSLAYTSQRLGDLELAMTIAVTTLDEATEWPLVARCRILHTVGFFHYCDGNLSESELRFQQNLRLAQQHELPIIALISQHGLGAIADARNQLETAEQYHLDVVRNPHMTAGREAVVDMYSLIRIYARLGQPEKSRELVDQLKADARMMGQSFLLDQVKALEAFVDLTCGEVESALRWALSRSRSSMVNVADRIPVIRTQILLADGSEASLREADQILQGSIAEHEANYAWYRLAEALVLHALVNEGLGQSEAALDVLATALHLAVPMGNVEPFLEHGPVIEGMLRKLETQPEHARLAGLLLVFFPADAFVSNDAALSKQAVPSQDLPEPLTERELDVLQLLGERFSNKEIARRLTVSPYTVRNHTANIYAKLQVDNRFEAVERAKSLGLLSA